MSTGAWTAGARKSGRNARWPYVPVVTWTPEDGSRGYARQVLGKAFETREDAVSYAQKYIAVNDANVARAEREYAERHAEEESA